MTATPTISGMRRHERPEMVVCGPCPHFREKRTASHEQERAVTPRPRWQYHGRPPTDYHKTCVWFFTREGQSASPAMRLTVMQAGANGGVGCPVTGGHP